MCEGGNKERCHYLGRGGGLIAALNLVECMFNLGKMRITNLTW